MSAFIQWMNPITGNIMWDEKNSEHDYHQEVARSAFADMLHDEERNKKYYAALKHAIEKKHKNGEEANVLDIGTGTGLLSMMAATCGADSIIACEAFKPMAECAAKIIKDNGFEDTIKLIHKRSTSLIVSEDGDLPKRANILVTELFDTELIGEGALSTFSHAHQVLLEKNSIVIPTKGTVWAQVIASSKVMEWNKLSPIYHESDNNFIFEANSCMNECKGTAAIHDLQLTRLDPNSFTPLMSPYPIFQFDWSGEAPLIFNETVSHGMKAIATGTAQAVFMWWDLDMDTDRQIILSCAPVWEHPNVKSDIRKHVDVEVLSSKIPWRDHWMQAIYYLPAEISITEGQEVTFIGCHDEYSFWFNLKSDPKVELEDTEKPSCNCYLHLAYSRTRIAQLNDKMRNSKFIEILQKKISSNTVCLCISDGSLLGIMAVKLGAKKVIILEPNSLSRRAMEVLVKANHLSTKVQIIESLEDVPKNSKVDLIVSEPYFVTSIFPWDNLRFWYLRSKFCDTEMFPISATIKAVAMEFKDLHKIRAALGICEGFNLSTFDKFVQDSSRNSDSPVEVQPLWEYFGHALGSSFTVASFDLTQDVNLETDVYLSNSSFFRVDGLCNGVALWIDWQLDTDVTVSTGPLQEIEPGTSVIWDPHSKQGVHLFDSGEQITCNDSLNWSFDFFPKDGVVKFDFHITKTHKLN